MRRATDFLVSDFDVWYFYFGFVPSLYRFYKSPFREDRTASCRFFLNENKRLIFNDFAQSEVYTTERAMMEKFNVTYSKAKEMMRLVKKQVDVTEIPKPSETNKAGPTFITEPLQVDYWKTFGINADTLKYFKVSSVSRVYFEDKIYWKTSKSNPIYHLPQSNGSKLYRPLASKKDKWLSSGSGFFGLFELPTTSTIVFITSSAKEVMLLYELGFPAVALPSESLGQKGKPSYTKIQLLIAHLRSRFKYILTLFDHDAAGLKVMEAFSNEFGVHGGTTNSKFKDLSDFFKHYGRKKTYAVVKKTIRKNL